jgi:broad specificity phosphatase PhoE
LTKRGKRQAYLVAEGLKDFKIDKVYTSLLKRARETAKMVVSKNNCSLIVSPDLTEINHGQWEGKTVEEVRREYPKVFRLWKTNPSLVQMPGGENTCNVVKRVQRFLKSIRKQENTVVVVAHDVVLRIILVELLGLSVDNMWRLRLDNSSLTVIKCASRPVLTLFNDTNHLKSLISNIGKQAL